MSSTWIHHLYCVRLRVCVSIQYLTKRPKGFICSILNKYTHHKNSHAHQQRRTRPPLITVRQRLPNSKSQMTVVLCTQKITVGPCYLPGLKESRVLFFMYKKNEKEKQTNCPMKTIETEIKEKKCVLLCLDNIIQKFLRVYYYLMKEN